MHEIAADLINRVFEISYGEARSAHFSDGREKFFNIGIDLGPRLQNVDVYRNPVDGKLVFRFIDW